MDNKSIRQQMRSLRNSMTDEEQQLSSSKIVDNIITSPQFKKCQNLALFLPNDHEPDLTTLIAYAWATGKNCYLPVLGRKFESRLSFQLYTPKTNLVINRFGIPEPIMNPVTGIIKPWCLDLILLPLVAFDKSGNRIGMGGGFYDRTLQYRQHRTVWKKPPLMGVAFAAQQVSVINAEKWDIPLDYIATNQEIRQFRH